MCQTSNRHFISCLLVLHGCSSCGYVCHPKLTQCSVRLVLLRLIWCIKTKIVWRLTAVYCLKKSRVRSFSTNLFVRLLWHSIIPDKDWLLREVFSYFFVTHTICWLFSYIEHVPTILLDWCLCRYQLWKESFLLLLVMFGQYWLLHVLPLQWCGFLMHDQIEVTLKLRQCGILISFLKLAISNQVGMILLFRSSCLISDVWRSDNLLNERCFVSNFQGQESIDLVLLIIYFLGYPRRIFTL